MKHKTLVEAFDIRSIIDSRGEYVVCSHCLHAHVARLCDKPVNGMFYCEDCDKTFTPLVASNDDIQHFFETGDDEANSIGYCYASPDKVRPFVRYRGLPDNHVEFELRIHDTHS